MIGLALSIAAALAYWPHRWWLLCAGLSLVVAALNWWKAGCSVLVDRGIVSVWTQLPAPESDQGFGTAGERREIEWPIAELLDVHLMESIWGTAILLRRVPVDRPLGASTDDADFILPKRLLGMQFERTYTALRQLVPERFELEATNDEFEADGVAVVNVA